MVAHLSYGLPDWIHSANSEDIKLEITDSPNHKLYIDICDLVQV